jgi:hypothetical protein
MYRSIILGLLLCSNVLAHEMTPTYPKWKVSYIEGVESTTMEMFNRRQDVEWYEIGIFNKEWKPVPFVTSYKILNLKYLSQVKFKVYISSSNVDKAEYICSTSKLRGDSMMVSSKICSRFK